MDRTVTVECASVWTFDSRHKTIAPSRTRLAALAGEVVERRRDRFEPSSPLPNVFQHNQVFRKTTV
jgi:hypothetical protein